MSSSRERDPLMPRAQKFDHPIFLRVCHSPWLAIGQSSLVALRGLVAGYMTIVFAMIMDYEFGRLKHGWLVPFEFQNISYLMQVAYAWTAFSWTFMHLNYPHQDVNEHTLANKFQFFFSPPKQTATNRTLFSIFYTSVLSFPFVVSTVYWLILYPHNKNDGIIADDLFGDGWFRPFIILNQYGGNAFFSVFEILVLCSIKRQDALFAHISGLIASTGAYLGWAYVGKWATGSYPYYFLDRNEIGWEYVVVAITSFGALANIFFAFVYGLTGLREMATKKSEAKSYGYRELPQ